MTDLPHPTPPSGMRFKGQALRLLAALLFGLLIMLLGGVLGVALISTLVAALAGAAAIWITWIVIKRLYMKRFRHPS